MVADKGLPPPTHHHITKRGIWNEIPSSKKSMDVNRGFLAWCSSLRNNKSTRVHHYRSRQWGGERGASSTNWCEVAAEILIIGDWTACFHCAGLKKYLSIVQLCELVKVRTGKKYRFFRHMLSSWYCGIMTLKWKFILFRIGHSLDNTPRVDVRVCFPFIYEHKKQVIKSIVCAFCTVYSIHDCIAPFAAAANEKHSPYMVYDTAPSTTLTRRSIKCLWGDYPPAWVMRSHRFEFIYV